MADKHTRWVIEATSNLPEVNLQLERLIQLQKTQNELTQQNTTSTALAIQRQREQIEALAGSHAKVSASASASATSQASVLGTLKNEYGLISKQLSGIVNLAAGAWAVGQLRTYVDEVINATSAQEGFVGAMQSMLGSRMLAEQLNSELMDIAKKSPFSIEQIQETTLKLSAMGVETSKLIPYINMLGDISSVVGTQKLPLIAKAMTDVQNKGTLMAQEIKQFTDNGVPIFDLLAKSMEKPRDEVVKLATAHKIAFADVEKALMKATEVGGLYYDQMSIKSQQMAGQVSNLTDKYELGLDQVGKFFDGGIRGGIGAMSELIEKTIGSQSAIERLVTVLKGALALYISQRAAVLIVNAALKANQVETLAGIAAKEADALANVQMTVTTGGLRTAMSGLWAVMKANPLGVVLTAVTAIYGAYQMWDAATMDVVSALGEQETQLKNGQAFLNGAVTSTMELKEGTEERTKAVQKLIDKYPEYFGGLNAEKVNNQTLKNILDSVNVSYASRIDLARQAYKLEELEKKRSEFLKEEFELMERIKKRSPELYAQVNGDVNKLMDAINKGGSSMLVSLDKQGGMLRNMWDNAMNGTILSSAAKISKGLKDIDAEILSSSKVRSGIMEKEQKDSIAAENARWKAVEASLKKGTGEYQNAYDTHTKNLKNLSSEFTESEIKAIEKVGKAKKTSLELSLENDIKELKSAKDTLENRMALLDKEEQLRVEQAKRLVKNAQDLRDRIDSIHTEYSNKREKLMKNEIDKLIDYDMKELKQAEKQSNALIKQKEKEVDEIEDLTNYVYGLQIKQAQETAEKILELRKKVKEAEVEGLKLSEQLGEKDAVLHRKFWQTKEQAVAEYWLKVKKLALDGYKLEIENLEVVTEKQKKLYGENSEEYQAAKLRLQETKNEATKAEGDYEQALNKVQSGNAMLAVQLVKLFESAFAGIYKTMASALEGYDQALEGTLKSYDRMKKANSEAMDFILKDSTLTYEEMTEALKQNMREQAAILRDTQELERLKDNNKTAMKELADGYEEVQYGFKAITSALNGDIGDTIGNVIQMFSSMARHAKEQSAQIEIDWQNRKIRMLEANRDSLEAQAQLEYELLQKKFAIWDEELEKFKATKEAEIAAAQAAIDAQKAAAEQFSSDSQLRLQEDSNYRQSLLVLGEQREVESLMAARDRQVKAAQERGATAQEVSDIVNAFEALITQKHQEYADARGNKEKEISLANQEVKAQETDKVGTLEQQLKDQITAIKDELAKKEQELSAQKQAAQEEYANYVKATQGAMYEAERQMAIAQIKIEIASLRGRKTIWNSGKINSAIGDLEEAMRDIQGLGNPYGYTNPSRGSGSGNAPAVVGDGSSRDQTNSGDGRGTGNSTNTTPTPSNPNPTTNQPRNLFHGDSWLTLGSNPDGIDTIPARLNRGERVMQSYLNQFLGAKVSNEQLVHGYLQYANMMDRLPDTTMMEPSSIILPDFGATKNEQSMERLERKLDQLDKTFREKSLLNINIDANKVDVSEERERLKVSYLNAILRT